MRRIIRIGTRNSELALWQANKIQRMLNELGYETEIVSIKSTGDIILNKPIYELGITGVFTRNLDIALLNDEIDITSKDYGIRRNHPHRFYSKYYKTSSIEHDDLEEIVQEIVAMYKNKDKLEFKSITNTKNINYISFI